MKKRLQKICHRSPTAIRWMIIGAAEHLCDELIAKLANTETSQPRGQTHE